MPYLLESTSSSGALELASTVIVGANVGDYVEFSGYAASGNFGDSYRLIGSTSGFAEMLTLTTADVLFKVNNESLRFSSGYVQPPINTDFVIRAGRSAAGFWEVRLNGESLGVQSSTNNLSMSALLDETTVSGNKAFIGGAYYIEACTDGTGAATNRWLNTTGTGSVWVDQISGINATQEGTWPANDSEWVFYEQGADYTIRKGATVTVSHALTAAGLTSATLNGQAVTIASQSGQNATINFTDTITTSGVYNLVLGDGVDTQMLTVQYNVIGLTTNTIHKEGASIGAWTDLEIDVLNASGTTILGTLTGLTTDASGITGKTVVPAGAAGDAVRVSGYSEAAEIGFAYKTVLGLL